MNERTIAIFGGIVILLGIVAIAIQLRYRSSSPPEMPSDVAAPAPMEAPIPAGQSCGTVTVQCTATAGLHSPSCDREAAVEELAAAVSQPLQTPGCSGAEMQLQQSCPSDCNLEPSSLLVIPGKPEYRFADGPDESGDCSVSARRPVTLSGECVR